MAGDPNVYEPDLADGSERFPESDSSETNDWDDDTAQDQENIPSDDSQ